MISLFAALGLLVYAAPRLETGNGLTTPTIFGVVWLSFALLIIAAQLHFILGVDKEMGQNPARVQKLRRWRLEQALQSRKVFQFQAKK